MSEYDFKAALEFTNDKLNFGVMMKDGMVWQEETETIQTALRLADRLQRGEVSKEMLNSCYDELRTTQESFKPPAWHIFSSMAAQMMKEIEND
jgi:hypothetical protein